MRLLTLDFETYYDREYSLSKMTTEAYIRDSRFEVILVGYKIDDGACQWLTGNHATIQAQLAKLVDWSDTYLLCHNTAFDGAILKWHFGLEPAYYLDTMSMARPITASTVGVSLAALAKKFMLGEKGTEVGNMLGMRRGSLTFEELTKYADYCTNDVQLTYLLYQILSQWIPQKEQYAIDVMLRMFIDPVIELDRDLLTDHYNKVVTRKEKFLVDIATLCDKDVLMSNPKFAELLKSLGVEPPMKLSPSAAKKGEEKWTYAFAKTDTQFKELLEHPDDRVQALCAARLGVKSTLEETRTLSMLHVQSRGPLPILLNYYGAHTGRASGGDGMNLQNLPRGGNLRKAMLPPDDHVIVAGDSSQIEARVVAYLAGQDDLVQAFANKEDVYSRMASQLYGVPVTKETEPDKRFIGKTVVLGCGYGLGHLRLMAALRSGTPKVDIAEEEAKRIVDTYRAVNSKIADLWKQANIAIQKMAAGLTYELGTLKLVCDGEGVHLPNGMIIRYNGLQRDADGDGWIYRQKGFVPVKLYGGKLIENIVQALARIIVFDQMCSVVKTFKPLDRIDQKKRYRVALTVHDELVAVVPKEAREYAITILTTHMSRSPAWAKSLPVACEVKSGYNYGECK